MSTAEVTLSDGGRPTRPALEAHRVYGAGLRKAAALLVQAADQADTAIDGVAAALDALESLPAPPHWLVDSRLSPREQQVLTLRVEGAAAKQIAYRLGISAKTARNQLANAYRKLGVTGLPEVIAYLRTLEERNGLVGDGDPGRPGVADPPVPPRESVPA
jgi:DNA-binding CsgD family transcriptional regulator